MNTTCHNNVWDNITALVKAADRDAAEHARAGRLAEFERGWLDAVNGKVSRLPEQAWFAGASPVARRRAANTIRRHVVEILSYYRSAAKLLR